MHCLGSGAGDQASPGASFGSRGSILSVVRALGVLVCEGRIQGPPRGYKEGPHCVPPLQSSPNNHTCQNDDYLCDRYLVLVREITERVAAGSYLCVEVVLCTDCACGSKKSKSKHRAVLGSPDRTAWQQQHSSEMVLEYWSIGVVPSKSPETMNAMGLYQAVRSRLHFSQVAAWWSRSHGAKPSCIATRIVSQQEDHLRKFREPPVEHTFPLAGLGDGNSVKVTVWALPRMEEIPSLHCSIHPQLQQTNTELTSDSHERSTTPTRSTLLCASPASSSASSPNGTVLDGLVVQPSPPAHLVMPALLDDRLHIACDKPGKHHCRCADEEDDEGTSTGQQRPPTTERKRRRSLPCRPPDIPASPPEHQPSLPALREASQAAGLTPQPDGVDGLEHSFRAHLSIDEQQGGLEKRLKRSDSGGLKSQQQQQHQQQQQQDASGHTHVPLLIPWMSYNANGQMVSAGLPSSFTAGQPNVNVVVNPLCTVTEQVKPRNSSVDVNKVTQSKTSAGTPGRASGNDRDLNRLMSKLSMSQEHEESGSTKQDQQTSIFEWISRVPGRVLGGNGEFVIGNANAVTAPSTPPTSKCELKTGRHCNLDLSPREFDEVLAVLRARTPLGRRRTALRTAKRKEKYDRLVNEQPSKSPSQEGNSGNSSDSVSNKADVLLGAILRTTSKGGPDRPKDQDTHRSCKLDSPLPNIKKFARVQATSSCSLESCCNNSFSSTDGSDGSLPSALNKRFSRLRQMFKRQDLQKTRMPGDGDCSSPQRSLQSPESKVKRRIDFLMEHDEKDENANGRQEQEKKKAVEDKDEDENEGEDEEDDEEDEEEDDENEEEEGDKEHETKCDSSDGTSTNSIQGDTIFLSTNNGSCCSEVPCKEEQQWQRVGSSTCCKKKSRGKRELSPIWVNHNNNNVSSSCRNVEGNLNETQVEEHNTEAADKTVIPTARDQERFRRSLEYAASMVFHSRTGLPLTSSPAPLRRGSCCFDFDSSLNSVSSKRSALFELNTPPSPGAVSLEEGDREAENVCDIEEVTRRRSTSRNRPQSHALLGSFEESALNGRLEPVSTVHGFTAEIGASGTFCPKHRKLPVTVFFYTLGDNDKISSPYLAHINLGKKGYQVPRNGTIQVTLLNPLGTVVKMFVVLYDLSDMPPRSHTFLRQRTLRDKALRYLIHLRFMSGKSGRIYLHTDVRMIICRKSDVDTASDFGSEPPKELRSYIHGPTNPKFSPRC